MAVIEKFGAGVRVFKRNIKPQEEAVLLPESFGGLFWIRMNATLNNPSAQGAESKIQEAAAIPISQIDLEYLYVLSATQKLLNSALKKLPSLSSCKNLDWMVSSLVEDIHCRFFFSPEILSGRGPRPVIFLDLKVVMRRAASETSSIDRNNLDHNVDNDAAQQGSDDHDLIINRWISLGNQNVDKDSVECQSEVIVGFDEVKANLKIKVFERSDDSEEQLCPICLENLVERSIVAETSCCHTFHKNCFFRWLLDSISCPICRSTCVAYV